MDEQTILATIPDSPAGRQIRWYMHLLLSTGEGASASDSRSHFTDDAASRAQIGATDEEERAGWRGLAAGMGAIADFSIISASEYRIEAALTAAKDRKWRLTIAVEDRPPHRISEVQRQRQFDFKIDTREATEQDGPALADLERRCPIVLGDTSIYFDRGDDYFAFARLIEDVTVGIALVDGVPAAASCGALHRVTIGGVVRPIMTVLHLRVVPEHQRKGLWGAVNQALAKYRGRYDGSHAYISVNNAGMQHGFINTPDKWGITALRVQLDCAALASGEAGRRATDADAAAIAAIVNTCHQREEMYLPYSAESLAARIDRAPQQYSWNQVMMTSRAVVGVWPAGHSLKVVSESKGARSESRRGVVLDYGFMPGAERELESLIRCWCARLAADGMDTLSIFTSPTSPGSAMLCSNAREVEPFNMWTPGIPAPPDALERGLYVDPIYF